MLDKLDPAHWDGYYGFLCSAGFSKATPTYLNAMPTTWTLDDLKAAVFTPKRSETVKLAIFPGEPHECLVAVTMVRPTFTPIDEYDDLLDWYVEGDNLNPSDVFGEKVRIYLLGYLNGRFSDLYIQTISDE